MANCWTVGTTRWSTNMFVKDINGEINDDELISKIIESRRILRDSNPDYIINTLDELPKILNILGFYNKY